MSTKSRSLLILVVIVLVALAVWKFMPSSSTTTQAEAGKIAVMEGATLDGIVADNKEKEKYLIVDVRSEEEYAEGHLRHAINIPLAGFSADDPNFKEWKDKPVVLVCNSGKKSGEAAKILVDAGFSQVYNAAGVKEYAYTTMTKVASLRFDQAVEAMNGTQPIIIDARDAKDYEAGHLPGAINASADTIDQFIGQLSTDAPVFTYCYSGNRSYAVAEKMSQAGFKTFNILDGTKEVSYDALMQK